MKGVALGLALFLASLAGASTGAESAAQKLRPDELGLDETPAGWSPDGESVLVGQRYAPPKGGSDHSIALARADGSGKRPLYRKPASDFEQWDFPGSFAPDGRRVIFSQQVGLETTNVMLVNADGSGLRTLTEDGPDSSEYRPTWSPDGIRLAFDRRDSKTRTRSGIWVMRADGRDQHQLTQHAGDFGAAWSPDGTLLAFTRWERSRNLRGYSVWVVRAEGADARRLTPDGRYEAAGWSPDGRFVVFTKDGGHFETNATVWVMRPDGTGKRRLAAGDMPSWSPDGRRIAFVRWSQTGERGVTTYVMNQDGTGVRRLFAGAAGSRWSPDSKRLAVSAQRGCNGAGVFVVDAATARARRLTNDCRITGTGLGERLRGTRERDVVQALGGDDTIDANPRDLPNVYAGRLDDDVVDGGAGADRVWGRRGVDVVRGGRGNDTIIGGRGADRLFGGPGDDLLVGGPYHDRLFGGPGADRLRGGAGNDRIFARDGSRDVVGCGHGRPDRVVADALDSVAADCELVSRR